MRLHGRDTFENKGVPQEVVCLAVIRCCVRHPSRPLVWREHDTMTLTAGSVASADTDSSDMGDISPLITDNSDNDDTSPLVIQLTVTTGHFSPTLVTLMTHHSRRQ